MLCMRLMRGRRSLLLGLVVVVGIGIIGVMTWFTFPVRRIPVVSERGLRIVTTTPVLYSLTAKVLGEFGTISNLVPPGASPENYALQPRDAEALERADVLVLNGLSFERFLAGVVGQTAQRGARVVVASEGIATAGDPPDPHVWVDPLRAKRMVENIARGLAAADPVRAETYRQNAGAAHARLEALDVEFRSQLAPLPEKRFLAFHPAWGYFAERYGLEQVAVVEETPGREPTAQELAELVTLVRQTGVRALMSEPQFSPKIVNVLARDLGLAVQEVNPEGGELSSEGYERFMRMNVAAFVRAWSVP